MRVSRTASLILLLFGALLAYPSDALACSCAGGMPLCESFWKTPVVFSGEALEIKKIPNHLGSEYPPDRLVKFRVHEAWRGGVSGVIEVHTGGGLGDCGFDFQAGRRYLVFAHQSKSQLSTGICSPTKLLDEATADLAYIRQPFAASAGGRIYGYCDLPEQRPLERWSRRVTACRAVHGHSSQRTARMAHDHER